MTGSAAQWRKSSFSDNAANCVEVAQLGPLLGVRDSKNTGGPVLTFPAAAFATLLRSI